jgi:hypothetical protein
MPPLQQHPPKCIIRRTSHIIWYDFFGFNLPNKEPWPKPWSYSMLTTSPLVFLTYIAFGMEAVRSHRIASLPLRNCHHRWHEQERVPMSKIYQKSTESIFNAPLRRNPCRESPRPLPRQPQAHVSDRSQPIVWHTLDGMHGSKVGDDRPRAATCMNPMLHAEIINLSFWGAHAMAASSPLHLRAHDYYIG